MTDDELQSRCIDLLRFPLAAGVVFIHAYSDTLVIGGVEYNAHEHLPVYHTVSALFSNVLGRLAIPVFFFISGFLFFLKSEWSFENYKIKLKSRLKTLLVPYVIWNLAVFLLYLTATLLPFTGDLFSGVNKRTVDYDMADIMAMFWNSGGGYPIAFQFWFIRDLMVIVLAAPLIRVLVRSCGVYGIAVLGAVWYSGVWGGIPGLSPVGIFFFSAGAFFSINNYNIVEKIKPAAKTILILYPLLAVCDLLSKGCGYNIYIHNAGLLAGVPFCFAIATYLLATGKAKVNRFLTGAGFFVFAAHEPLMTFVRKFLYKYFSPSGDIPLTLLYFSIPLAVIAATLTVYYLLKKYLPRLANLITGNR